MREWYLLKAVSAALVETGMTPERASLDAALLRACLSHAGLLDALQEAVWAPCLHDFLHNPEVQQWLGVHPFGGRRWMNKEQWDVLLDHLLHASALRLRERGGPAADALCLAHGVAQTLREAAADCNYDVDATLDCLK
jgi:hypothetical protein